ncbi:uncharacterized protein LOC110114659 [Dendrobium catenatum]|uniref:uncharacterized protein LOC110114659 n=1 Tax=Dendrobium catenatum TaxID=906689 RepID=UPI0009F5DF49|nr:uncharacterized protein LOC110114659 [Dendrobium catenatum]
MNKSEYGPWIHVHFKNRRFIKGGAGDKAKDDNNGGRLGNRGDVNQEITTHKHILSEKKSAVIVEKLISGPETTTVKDKTVEDIRSGISLSNKFAVLIEDSEADLTGKPKEYGESHNRILETAGVMSNVISCSSGTTKVKLSKELKSLGSMDSDFKKKKRDGRGARKKEAALYLKKVVRDQNIFFIGLMETKMINIDRKDVDGLIGKDWDFFHFPADGLSGGILVLWNIKVVTFVVIESSSQMIVGDLSIPNLGLWKVAIVYGSRCCKERELLWSQLSCCMDSSTPYIIGGDFNFVLNKEEKRCGKRFLFSKGPKDMKHFMKNFDFHDLGSIGPRFTWCNNKEGASRIWERLDRCILNSVALQKLPIAATMHLARVASDHSPIAFKMDDKVRIKSKTIKFEDTWRSYTATISIVYHAWRKNDFGDEDLNVLKEELKKEILDLQHKEVVGIDWSAQDLLLLRSKIHDLNVTLKRLSTWWNQRAKARWHEDGDTNSKMFHSFATARRNGNRVNQIKDMQNKMQVEDDEIEKVFIQHFEAKWKSIDCELAGWPKICENQKLTSKEVATLNSDFTVGELQESVFQQGNNRSPDWKDTLIVLITKVKNPVLQSNYRPISLCQTNYKIAASILVNRLKKCIPKLITEEQMAFIPDVRFSIIINGKNFKWINACSGFRQGCPLSPYLYIMCSQLMSNSLEQRGQSLGIQLSPRGPRITHLMYADDVLIFSHASKVLAKTLKPIVEDFCKWTGQRINVNKSQIIFSQSVSYPMKKKLAKVFGFKVVKELNYLGTKISLNRLRVAGFQDLLINAMDRLNGWGKKSFSMGGKITLITSSLLTMPNFLVTHSLIPKSVLYAMEKCCRSFIWHKSDASHSIHYVAWEELCKSRSMGGLGLQSPVMKDGSLRSKLAWSFMQKPDTLFHRSIIAKYGKDVMNGTHNKATSMVWQILSDGGRNLRGITRWRVGNGGEINVLNDV